MASMSKRAQARTEKELHDLIRAPGNSTCADCGARNPSWASWNLGIFLCMRCASIHRKLGTHISKVKSLSMDTWSNDQLEYMKKNGNLAVNKMYNPKNKRPDMPLDADEVDGAMERFIRKKYQEKSLTDGRPEVPSRDAVAPTRSKSPDTSPPAALPSKKGRFFGFGLRASSSAYPLSKHDKKHRNEPRVDSTFRISSDDYTSGARTSGSRAEMSDHDLQLKLAQLRDMGFSDSERNTNILKRNNGDIERTIAALVKLGPSEQPVPRRTTPTPTNSVLSSAFPAASTQSSVSATQSTAMSNNPFDQISQPASLGLSPSNTAPQSSVINTNPWQQAAIYEQSTTGLEQSFSNMQVHAAQPLFPHSTGGYPGQQQYGIQVAAPPVPNIPQQYAATGSPLSMNNPFMQAPLSAHSTGSNPYAAHMQNMPTFAPSNNPFLNASPPITQQASFTPQSFNPFGLPPSNSPSQTQSVPAVQQNQSNPFGIPATYVQSELQAPLYGGMQFRAQQQTIQSGGAQSPPPLPNFQNAQPQPVYLQQPQQHRAQTYPQVQNNPYLQQVQQAQPQPQVQAPLQSQIHPAQQQQQQQQQQQSPLMPQQTGQMDKRSILALYNYPQLAPAKPLASIPEPTDDQNHMQQQMTSPAPSGMIYGNTNNINIGKRSATMPASSMHSAGGTGSRNPFMGSTNSSGSSTPAMPAQQPFGSFSQGSRHASHDSMIVNNPVLQDGRHSPDAFASLSARYMR